MFRVKFTGIFSLFILFLACRFNVLEAGLRHFQITSIAFSPDGKQLAIAGGLSLPNTKQANRNKFELRVLDAANGKLIKAFGDSTFSPNSIDWSPDGTRIVSSSDEGFATVWNVATGEEVSHYSRSGGDAMSLFGASWNPVDERIVVLGGGRYTAIWDAQTGNLITWVNTSDYLGVIFSAWSPDGMKLALGTAMNEVDIFDVDPSFEKPPLLSGINSGPMTNLTWSPDGTQIATLSGQEIRIFDAKTGKMTQTLIGSTNNLWGISWTAVGNRIAAGGSDYKVRVWDASTGQETAVFDHQASITSIDWSPDGQYLAFGGWENADYNGFEIVSVPFIDK